MSTSSYRAEAGTVQGHLDIGRFIATPKGEIAGRVLLVDDLADSGVTLKAVVKMLKTNYQPITELRSAVIWTKGVSTFQADYSVEDLPTNPGSTSLSKATTPVARKAAGEVEGLSPARHRSEGWCLPPPHKAPQGAFLHGACGALGSGQPHSVAIGMQPPIAGCVYQKVSALDRCNGDLSQ
jgi:hypothetical protein